MLLLDPRGSDGDGQTQGLKSGLKFKGQHNSKSAGLNVERTAAKFQAPRSTSCVLCGKQLELTPRSNHRLQSLPSMGQEEHFTLKALLHSLDFLELSRACVFII